MLKLISVFMLSLFLLCTSAVAAINLNSASQSELETLRGIGPAKAKAIIEYREKHGPFHSVDDIAAVKGIGPKLLEKIKNQIEISKN